MAFASASPRAWASRSYPQDGQVSRGLIQNDYGFGAVGATRLGKPIDPLTKRRCRTPKPTVQRSVLRRRLGEVLMPVGSVRLVLRRSTRRLRSCSPAAAFLLR